MNVMNHLQQKPNTIFLIDALGALGTAGLLYFLVGSNEQWFGLPRNIVHVLVLTALVFFVYSFSCFLLKANKWKPLLKIIAFCNMAYTVVTAVLMIQFAQELTNLGFCYFIGEIIVILLLVWVEWKLIKL
jgi:hypothetical protein